MVFTIALTVGFGSSDRLAGAYGTAVSTTMWHWPVYQAGAVTVVLLAVDLAFFSANLLKISEGGWIPLTFGALVFIIMTTWHYGVEAVHRRNAARSQQPGKFFEYLRSEKK